MEIHLSQDAAADRLLSRNPMALLIGMVLDQQVPLEWAFAAPAELSHRLGQPLTARNLAELEPDELVTLFTQKPALHRYPASMAKRVHELARIIVEHYGGKADGVWKGASSGVELLRRVRELPGFGEHKAKIFVALLGKQLGVQPPGWREASSPFGDPGTLQSVADITDGRSLGKVRAYKQGVKKAAKADAHRGTPGARRAAVNAGSPRA